MFGCYFCNEAHPNYSAKEGIIESEGEYVMKIETYEWNDYYDEFVSALTIVKFCPMCGRELRGGKHED